MEMQGAIKELQDTAIVVAGIQERQSRVLKGQSKWLDRHELWMAKHEKAIARHDVAMAEIEDKLNGLIGGAGDMVRRRKPQ